MPVEKAESVTNNGLTWVNIHIPLSSIIWFVTRLQQQL
jgi:hypothetical protein